MTAALRSPTGSRSITRTWWYQITPEHMGQEAYDDLQQALHNPDVVHGMVEDYRAGVTVDREADEADRAAGRTIGCPLLVGWSTRDDLEELYGDIVGVWRAWAHDVRGIAIDSGHHLAEEAPSEVAATLLDFFKVSGSRALTETTQPDIGRSAAGDLSAHS